MVLKIRTVEKCEFLGISTNKITKGIPQIIVITNLRKVTHKDVL